MLGEQGSLSPDTTGNRSHSAGVGFKPGEPHATSHYAASDATIRLLDEFGSAENWTFEALSGGLQAPCVRFAAGPPPQQTTLDSGQWPMFAGSGPAPSGSQSKVPSSCSL